MTAPDRCVARQSLEGARGLPGKLCPMTAVDLPEVLTIEQRVYEYPWSEGIFRDCLRAGQCCWTIREVGVLVAYGVMSVAAGESHLLNLCVDPDYTRRGCGRGLLDHLQGLALRHRATVMFLEVRPSNREALALYRDNGFAEVGLRRGYYPAAKGREDALVMARELGDLPDWPGWPGSRMDGLVTK